MFNDNTLVSTTNIAIALISLVAIFFSFYIYLEFIRVKSGQRPPLITRRLMIIYAVGIALVLGITFIRIVSELSNSPLTVTPTIIVINSVTLIPTITSPTALLPTITPSPTITPTPTPLPPTAIVATVVPETPPNSQLAVGDTWIQDGMGLTLLSVSYSADAIWLRWSLENMTTQSLAVTYKASDFTIENNLGEQLDVIGFVALGDLSRACLGSSQILRPGEKISLGCAGTAFDTVKVSGNFIGDQITEIRVRVNVARIRDATFVLPIDLS